jgi:oligo-1,6-glucosidase
LDQIKRHFSTMARSKANRSIPGHQPWWKEAAIYQIYPASFNDSNTDGVGDIPGITQKLDYIKSLGVDVIWVCPMYVFPCGYSPSATCHLQYQLRYASPQIDMGYDISDYEAVHPPYGTMEDMGTLIQEVHARDMRIILDLVINHTSDQHKWFQESRSSKTNDKRDWYIWKPAKYDSDGIRQPPNNWRSNFGGSVWQWDDLTEEYYLHLFCPEQPDINFECDAARQAIYQSAMISWLERGVDGFRIDTVNMYSKPIGLPDAPIKDAAIPWQDAGLVYCNGPRMDEYLGEMNAILSRYDAMSVGECPNTPDPKRVFGYVSEKAAKLNMVFQFDSVDVGIGSVSRYSTEPFNYTLGDIKNAICRTQSLIGEGDAWTTSFIENHDQARSISRYGDDSTRWRNRSGKMLAMLFASLSGTLFIYQGQEIGMINMPAAWSMDEYKDVDSINCYAEAMRNNGKDSEALAYTRAALQHLSRDHARTPMQWTSHVNAGFTDEGVTPWMRVNTSAQEGINVSDELNDESSVLNFWREMLHLRQKFSKVFIHGKFELVDRANPDVLSFTKTCRESKSKVLIVCNFSDSESKLPLMKNLDTSKAELLLNNLSELAASDVRAQKDSGAGPLQPWESRTYVLRS